MANKEFELKKKLDKCRSELVNKLSETRLVEAMGPKPVFYQRNLRMLNEAEKQFDAFKEPNQVVKDETKLDDIEIDVVSFK